MVDKTVEDINKLISFFGKVEFSNGKGKTSHNLIEVEKKVPLFLFVRQNLEATILWCCLGREIELWNVGIISSMAIGRNCQSNSTRCLIYHSERIFLVQSLHSRTITTC